jgi:ketosteroid isomerase-like protein
MVTALLLLVCCVKNNPSELTEAEVEKLKEEMNLQFKAMIEGDVKTLERMYSDDFVINNRKGMILEKAKWIELIKSGHLRYLSVGEQLELSIKLYGRVAVVRGLMGSTVFERNGERSETGPRRFTAVWVYEKNGWRQVTRQHTAVASKMDEFAGEEIS